MLNLPAAIVLAGLSIPAAMAADEFIIEDDLGGDTIAIEDEIAIDEDIVLDEGLSDDGELLLDENPGGLDAIELPVFDHTDGLAGDEQLPAEAGGSDLSLSVDDVRLEYGHQLEDAAADNQLYANLAVSLNWRPHPEWELQLAGRVDGYDQGGSNEWSDLRADYGDSYVRYRGDGIRLTAGAQTLIWGRMDEVPLSDRVSTADLTRFVLDRLEDRRRSTPMLRAEADVGEGKLDLVWLYDFRPAELPDQDSIWYPIDRVNGRILGVKSSDIPPALVQVATIDESEPDGDGGFGARYTASPYFGDIGLTIAHTRRSTPYYRLAGPATFKTEYPRSWALGADTAVDAMGVTWRAEVVYTSDNPVTRRDLSFDTIEGIEWGMGVEMHPGDGDTRVNLQLVGSNLIDPGAVFDRTEAYSFNGEVDVPFDRERWRASLNFLVGLDQKDIYLNPEISFLGWEPHEFYLALHYFEGDEQTLTGFHEDHSLITLGWRAAF